MQANTSTPWWAGARLLAATALASCARLPLIIKPAIAVARSRPDTAQTLPKPTVDATLMSKISAIASTLANVLKALVAEIDRHRRRERHFRHLSRRQGEPFLMSKKLRFLHVPEPHVSFLHPGTRLRRLPHPGKARVSWLR